MMIKAGKVINVAALCFVVSGCVFFPSVSDQQDYIDECDMLTKELTLSSELYDLHRGCGSDVNAPACYLAMALGAPAISYVVSGSIVLAGNTLHWLEYQGRCEGKGITLESTT